MRLELPNPLPYSSNCDVAARWNVKVANNANEEGNK